MRRERGHRVAPLAKHIVEAVRIRSAEDRTAEMIQYDRRIGKARGEVRYLAQLRMINPRVESQTQTREASKALAKLRLGKYMRTRHGLVHARVAVPRGRESNRVKAAAA